MIDQPARGKQQCRFGGHRADLGMEVLGQRLAPAAALVDIRAFATRPAAAEITETVSEIASRAVSGIAVPVEGAGVDIERTVFRRAALADQLIDRRGFERRPPQRLRLALESRIEPGIGRALAHFEQRIGIQRLTDECLDLEV